MTLFSFQLFFCPEMAHVIRGSGTMNTKVQTRPPGKNMQYGRQTYLQKQLLCIIGSIQILISVQKA